jgi:hypothetical protein
MHAQQKAYVKEEIKIVTQKPEMDHLPRLENPAPAEPHSLSRFLVHPNISGPHGGMRLCRWRSWASVPYKDVVRID